MGSPRTPGSGEVIASHEQSGEKIQETGVMLWNGSQFVRWTNANSDSEPSTEIPLVSPGLLNSSGTFDRQRRNQHLLTAFSAAERTTTVATSPILNYNWSKISINLEIIKSAGSGKTLTVSVFGVGTAASRLIRRFPAVEGSRNFQLSPGLPEYKSGEISSSEGFAINAVLPGSFVIQVIPSDATPWEYEVIYDLLI